MSGATSEPHLRFARVHAREILDSRGKPTVEVEVRLACGALGRAAVPSGASTGKWEAFERRDTDLPRYSGQGVARAVEAVRGEIAARLLNVEAGDQAEVDRLLIELDGTPNKQRLGANAILGVSLATAAAVAAARGETLCAGLHRAWKTHLGKSTSPALPLPMVNMISGGKHAGGNLDFQDYLILPVGAAGYSQALEWIVRVYWELGRLLSRAGYEGRLVGDEGGYGPRLPDNRAALRFIVDAVVACGLRPGEDVGIGLDVASTHFFDPATGEYRLAATGGAAVSATGMVDLLARWVEEFPIVSIEDGLAEDDWSGWRELTRVLGGRVQLIGDDLFVTNVARLRRGIEENVANCVLVKVNQIGTLTETFATLETAREHGYRTVVSARSGETEDAWLADLATATAGGQIKVGSVARSERLAKYNQLLRLEEEFPGGANWSGWEGMGAR
jgi:enolase